MTTQTTTDANTNAPEILIRQTTDTHGVCIFVASTANLRDLLARETAEQAEKDCITYLRRTRPGAFLVSRYHLKDGSPVPESELVGPFPVEPPHGSPEAPREPIGVGNTVESALAWALDLLDMYDTRLVALGDPPHLVRSDVHLAGKARARALLESAGLGSPEAVQQAAQHLKRLHTDSLPGEERCPLCGGRGYRGNAPKPCEGCDGTGFRSGSEPEAVAQAAETIRHTPGPWRYLPNSLRIVDEPAGRLIATVNEEQLECGGNIRLIASAPDLLKQRTELIIQQGKLLDTLEAARNLAEWVVDHPSGQPMGSTLPGMAADLLRVIDGALGKVGRT